MRKNDWSMLVTAREDDEGGKDEIKNGDGFITLDELLCQTSALSFTHSTTLET